jgi:tetratricopeptide (TPR) repeat protein
MAQSLESLLKAGAQLLDSGRLADAEQLADALLRQLRGTPDVHLFAADVADACGDRQAALDRLTELSADARASGPVAIRIARLLLAQRQRREARAVALAARLDSEPWQFAAAARVLSDCVDPEGARDLLARGHAQFPTDIAILSELAMADFHVNRIDDADQHLEQLLALAPYHPGALRLRSALRQQTIERNHVQDLERRLADRQGRPNFVVGCCFALAKEYEDLGQYDNSFAALRRGAQTYRRTLQYDSRTELETLATIRANFTADAAREFLPGFEAEGPIFIVGMPRTGTTLVERVLTSHSHVTSVGELTDFPLLLTEVVQEKLAATPQLELEIEASLQIDFRELGRRYMAAARQVAGDDPYFVDKLPYNFLYCGYIFAALPQAKIIHLRRDPLDTCYAVYKTLFFNAYSYSYDLDELVDYYIAYRKQMDHWHAVLPGRILDVGYEELVREPEAQSRRILDWIGLPWQPSVLNFHEQQRPSMTASAMQVRRPMYTDSIGAWRRVEADFAPVRERLHAAGLLDDGAAS